MLRHSFRAMGTNVEALLDAEPHPEGVIELARVEREFSRLESILSRFRPDSELCRLNESGSLEAGDDLLSVARLAIDARERTGGRFDPTVHDALVAAGYDRSFELVDGHRSKREAVETLGEVRIDGRRIVLGEGVRLDFGGIGKGYAVDRTVGWLAPYGPCLVNAGGDLAVAGLPAAGTWPVAIHTPRGQITVGVTQGALATSGRDRRKWQVGGEERHHLIDPATTRPAATDLLKVTVAAPTAVEAEVLAKSLFLVGENRAAAEADAERIPALLVTADGRTRRAGGLS
jgi:thiamine biosynthesis lipoprotein